MIHTIVIHPKDTVIIQSDGIYIKGTKFDFPDKDNKIYIEVKKNV